MNVVEAQIVIIPSEGWDCCYANIISLMVILVHWAHAVCSGNEGAGKNCSLASALFSSEFWNKCGCYWHLPSFLFSGGSVSVAPYCGGLTVAAQLTAKVNGGKLLFLEHQHVCFDLVCFFFQFGLWILLNIHSRAPLALSPPQQQQNTEVVMEMYFLPSS